MKVSPNKPILTRFTPYNTVFNPFTAKIMTKDYIVYGVSAPPPSSNSNRMPSSKENGNDS